MDRSPRILTTNSIQARRKCFSDATGKTILGVILQNAMRFRRYVGRLPQQYRPLSEHGCYDKYLPQLGVRGA